MSKLRYLILLFFIPNLFAAKSMKTIAFQAENYWREIWTGKSLSQLGHTQIEDELFEGAKNLAYLIKNNQGKYLDISELNRLIERYERIRAMEESYKLDNQSIIKEEVFNLLSLYPQAKGSANENLVKFMLGDLIQSINEKEYYMVSPLIFISLIVEDPSGEIAKISLELLTNDIILGYSGSSGTHIPSDWQALLTNLEKRVYAY